MTDHQVLFLALGMIYAWECLSWVRHGSVAFRRLFGRQSRIVLPSTSLGNARGGFVWGWPLPPLGELATAAPMPFFVGPWGIAATAVAGAGRVAMGWRWDEIPTLEIRGRWLSAGPRRWAECGSPEAAAAWKDEIARLTGMPEGERLKALSAFMASTVDLEAVRARVDAGRNATRPLKYLCNVYFLVLLVLAPALGLTFGFGETWWILAILVAGLGVATTWRFHLAHRSLFPTADDSRFTHAAVILLAPPAAVRACDAVWRGLLERFHPVAVAKVVGSPEGTRALARRAWKEVRFPMGVAGAEPSVLGCVRWHREEWERIMRRLLEGLGIGVEELEAPPEPLDATCHTWCPQCEAQFTRTTGECPDCGRATLRPLRKAGE